MIGVIVHYRSAGSYLAPGSGPRGRQLHHRPGRPRAGCGKWRPWWSTSTRWAFTVSRYRPDWPASYKPSGRRGVKRRPPTFLLRNDSAAGPRAWGWRAIDQGGRKADNTRGGRSSATAKG